MTAQLSRERLEEKLLEHIKHGGDSEEETMLRMLLARLDNKPVAWIVHARQGDMLTSDGNFVANAEGISSIRSTPLYAAPPAPVAVPDFEEWCQRTEQKPVGWVREAMKEAYDGCLAAMLKAGPVTGWIKCSERMPPQNDQDIWLWNGSVQSGYIWNGDRFVDWNEEYQELRGVTHWMPMPLPAAPEQEV